MSSSAGSSWRCSRSGSLPSTSDGLQAGTARAKRSSSSPSTRSTFALQQRKTNAHAFAEPDVDPGRSQPRLRVSSERSFEFGEKTFLRLHQHERHPIGRDSRVVTSDVAEKIVDSGGRLHTRRTAGG